MMSHYNELFKERQVEDSTAKVAEALGKMVASLQVMGEKRIGIARLLWRCPEAMDRMFRDMDKGEKGYSLDTMVVSLLAMPAILPSSRPYGVLTVPRSSQPLHTRPCG